MTIKVAQARPRASNHRTVKQDSRSQVVKTSYNSAAIMKIYVIVLLASCTIISNICYTQAAYARSEAEVQDLYDQLAQMEQSAKVQQGIWSNIRDRIRNQPITVYCYSGTGCTGSLSGVGSRSFCCSSSGHGGKSYTRTGDETCRPCSLVG